MRIEIKHDRLCMQTHQTLSVHGGVGRTVVCHSGSLWVTQDYDRRDIILGEGETFTLDREGVALVYAFEPSALSIRRPAGKPVGGRLMDVLRTTGISASLTRRGAHA